MFSTLSFWYGLGFNDLARMPLAAINAYHRDLPKHRSAMSIMLAEAVSFPYMDEAARKARVSEWERAAGVRESQPQYALNVEKGVFEEVADGKP